eukprot:1453075-Pleurochrysis_carterae.AAC.1
MSAVAATSFDEVVARMAQFSAPKDGSGVASNGAEEGAEGAEAVRSAAPFLCEFKYDGERCQVHLLRSEAEKNGLDAGAVSGHSVRLGACVGAGAHADAGADADSSGAVDADADGSVAVPPLSSRRGVRLFSRSMDDMSDRFPDIVKMLPSALPRTISAILDAELVAYDRLTKRMLPFQVLASRARKAPTAEQIASVPVALYAFDLLEHNGECLMERTLAERRALLRSVVEPVPGMFFLAEATEASDVGGLTHAMATAVGAHCEGLMVKALHGESSKYEAGKRSLHWLKLKEDYLQGANRT